MENGALAAIDAAPKEPKQEPMPDVPTQAISPAPATAGATEVPENGDDKKRKRHDGETPEERVERKRKKKEKKKEEKRKSNDGSE